MPPDCFPYARARLLIAAVARRHGLIARDLTEYSRWKHIAAARKEAMREVAAAFPKFSLNQIGTLFGGRHHTTIFEVIGPRPGRRRRRHRPSPPPEWVMRRVDGVTCWRNSAIVDRL